MKQYISSNNLPFDLDENKLKHLTQEIKTWGKSLGFIQVAISPIHTEKAHQHLLEWLSMQYEGTMHYMRSRAELRKDPSQLLKNAQRAICVLLPYRTNPTQPLQTNQAVSLYAHGRDYHKVVKQKLKQLQQKIQIALNELAPHTQARAFCDSAPIFEVEFASQAGLGWRGKNTLLIHPKAGSLFFLGEILTTLPLPVDPPIQNHCGRCTRCLDICPTRAFVSPYVLDATRCISYLTIEHDGAIVEGLRPLMGQHIYGCDDCQVVCPWNKFALTSFDDDFQIRNDLDQSDLDHLLTWFSWDEKEFQVQFQGSAILRIGHARWIRNISIALGNLLNQDPALSLLKQEKIQNALLKWVNHPVDWVREHIQWALQQNHHSKINPL
jgi:epoxyqueuosine reductase